MKIFIQIFIVASGLFLIGCGGGGATVDNTVAPLAEVSSEAYVNSVLPTIKESTLPKILLKQKDSSSSKIDFYKESNEQSNGFVQLVERVRYFYLLQLNMNIHLSYVDSVWTQIDSYCTNDNTCYIPKDKISFTYTQALYNHDMNLINLYEKKSGDFESFRNSKSSLKENIGEKVLLGEVRFTILEESLFNYELRVDISNTTVDKDNLTSIVRWNDAQSLYQTREELRDGYNGDRGICDDREKNIIYNGFDYNKSLDTINSSFEYGYDVNCSSTSLTSQGEVKDTYIQKHNRSFKLTEQSDVIKLTEHIFSRIISDEYHTPLDSYLEGELTESGGFVIASDTEGFYNHETFDVDGNLNSNISCIGDESRNLDDCTVQGTELIKSIVIQSYYKVGVFDDTPINVIATHSAVFFNEDNTLDAFINCSTFKAEYLLNDKGIHFLNIKEEQNSSLVCLDDSYAKNFRNFLKKGYEFNEQGYIVWNGLSAELDVVDEKTKFDKNTFFSKLKKNRYVDSYTMNNLFKVHELALGGFLNLSTNQNYFLSEEPSMRVENDKIYFDLIDATFEADIEVLDNDRIKFTNIVKADKVDFTYPVRSCTNEAGPNECVDGKDESVQYEDNIFSNVIESFLNSSVSVTNGGSPESGSLWFHNDDLSFEGSYFN